MITSPARTCATNESAAAASSRAGGRPASAGAATSCSRAGSRCGRWIAAGPSRMAPTTTVMPMAAPAKPSAAPAPHQPAMSGSSREPAAYDATVAVCMSPNARPRISSGTMRWNRVVPTTSMRRLPEAARVIASSAGTRLLIWPSPMRPMPNTMPAGDHGRAEAAPQDERAGDDRTDDAADPDRRVEVAGRRIPLAEDVDGDDDGHDRQPAEDEAADDVDEGEPREGPRPLTKHRQERHLEPRRRVGRAGRGSGRGEVLRRRQPPQHDRHEAE